MARRPRLYPLSPSRANAGPGKMLSAAPLPRARRCRDRPRA
jgi:hypothetical protein